MCEESAPEDLGKSISISGGQNTQSDPCYTLTKVLIRISLKGRKRQGEKHIACIIGCFGQEPVGRTLISCAFFFFYSFFNALRIKVPHEVFILSLMMNLLKSPLFGVDH